MVYLWIALGSALGGVARFWLSLALGARFGTSFPIGTLLVNVTGCFVIGLFAALTGPDARLSVPPNARLFVMVGICGGYTTFSSFSLQTLDLAAKGQWRQANLNVFGSVLSCLAAVWLGHTVATLFNRR